MKKLLVKLKNNNSIGICAPASSFKKELFLENLKLLKNFKTTYSQKIFNKLHYTAGPYKDRNSDLISKLESNKITALFFARGGYGSIQAMSKVSKIPNKIIMGYSDITTILLYVYKQSKLPVFYGPNIASSFFTSKILSYFTKTSNYPIVKELKCLNISKNIEAPIIGGCLSIISSLVGTPYLPSFKNHILFLEDTNETPYKIDRMLWHLHTSGSLTGVKAILVGNMHNCTKEWKIPFQIIASKLNIPIYYGLKVGHGGFNYPLPFGIKVKIESNVLTIPSPFKE